MEMPEHGDKAKAYKVMGIIAMCCIMIPCCIVVGFIVYIMQRIERTAHNRQRCWKAGEPEGATPASGEIVHRLWRCLLLAERVLSAAKRMPWKGSFTAGAAGVAHPSPHTARHPSIRW